MDTTDSDGIWRMNPDRLRYALSAGYRAALDHVVPYPPRAGELDERPKYADPFALVLIDLSGAVNLTRADFSSTQKVINVMERRLVAFHATPGYDQPLAGPRYAVDGRQNLCHLEIASLKAAELLASGGTDNLALLHTHQKWAGATSSFGGVLLIVTLGKGKSWPMVIAGSGYKSKYDQLVVDLARGFVRYELIEMGAVDVTPINSATFLLGPDHTWAYPGEGVRIGGN
jgi:hypothetical protein